MKTNSILITFLACTASLLWAASDTLTVFQESGQLKIKAPQLRFVIKRAAQRLKNGVTVRYSVKVSAIDEDRNRTESSVTDRITLSYDLWEERYVASVDSKKDLRTRSKSIEEVERWAIEQLPTPRVTPTTRYRFRLELELIEANRANEEEAGALLQIVDLFSRRSGQETSKWQLDSVAARPADLRESKRR